jgi:hypothetical protein
MTTALEDEIRNVLTDHPRSLCARRVAEIVTARTGSRFGGCGPETSTVEQALRAMPDVEEDEDAYTEDDGEAYRRAQARNGDGSPTVRFWLKTGRHPVVSGVRLTVETARPLLLGAGDEVYPFALRLVERVAKHEDSKGELHNWTHDAIEEWSTTPAGDSAEQRAALLRMVAAGVALLVLDELERGTDVVEREVGRLDADGRLT